MAGDESAQPAARLTARGAATRARIVTTAAELMHVKGVEATTLAEILILSGSSKSQFRQHFDDKDDLIRAVIAYQAGQVLSEQTLRLRRIDSIRGLEQWCDALLRKNELRRGAWGCELGSLSAELSDTDDFARLQLVDAFREWERLLAEAFTRMRDCDVLIDDVDPAAMATALIGAVEGGYLLAQLRQDSAPMRLVLEMALRDVRSFQRCDVHDGAGN